VLNSEGLLRYVDSRCVQRELSEAAGISEEEMDELAHELLNMRQEDAAAAAAVVQPFQTRGGTASIALRSATHRGFPGTCWSPDRSADDGERRAADHRDVEAAATAATTTSKERPPYYEHLGGYGMDELKDYNEYSKRSSTVVARVARRLYWFRDRGSSSSSGGNGNGNGSTRNERLHPRRKLESTDGGLPTPWTTSRPDFVPDGRSAQTGCPVRGRGTRPRAERQRRHGDCTVDEVDEATMYITSL
jgi:hypothetical protein